jgi:hypothetical protein
LRDGGGSAGEVPLRTSRWRPPSGNGLREALAGLVERLTHGVQFKAAYLCAAPPTTLQGIERYLRLGFDGHRPRPRRQRPIRPLPPVTGS